jgi:thioredoxin-like negative regulator of GroEL
VLSASRAGNGAGASSVLASDAVDVTDATIDSWANEKAGDWLVMVYLDEDWNCVEYAPAWESVVDGLQGMIGVGRVNMRVSKGLGASLALSGDYGLLLPTLVMFRDGQFMASTHVSPNHHSSDSVKLLVAKTYAFVYGYLVSHASCIISTLPPSPPLPPP